MPQNSISPKYIVVLFVILTLSVLSKLVLFDQVYSLSPKTVIQSDTPRYEEPALQYLKEGTLAIAPQSEKTTTLSTTPVYSLFIVGIYKVFGEKNHPALMIAQIIVSALTLFLIFLLALQLWGSKTAVIVAGLMAIEPLQTLYAQSILSETLFTFFLAFSLLAFTYLLSTKNKFKWALLLGLMLTLATMTRPISYYLVFCIILGLVIFKQYVTHSWSQLLSICLLILLPFLLTTTFWKVRNENLTGVYALNDAMSETLLYYKAKGVLMVANDLSDEEAQKEIIKRLPSAFKTPKERADAESKLAKEIILGDLGSYLKLSLQGIKAIVLGPGLKSQAMFYDYKNKGIKTTPGSAESSYKPWYIALIAYGLVFIVITYLFAAYGFFLSFKHANLQHLVIHFLMLGSILYFVLISTGHTAADSRMRTPIIPIILLYASYGLFSLLEAIKSRKIRKNKHSI